MANAVEVNAFMTAMTANGDSALFYPEEPWNRRVFHQRTLYVWGIFGTGRLQIQISPDGVNWFNVGGLIAANYYVTLTDKFYALKLTLSAKDNSTSLNAYMQ